MAIPFASAVCDTVTKTKNKNKSMSQDLPLRHWLVFVLLALTSFL